MTELFNSNEFNRLISLHGANFLVWLSALTDDIDTFNSVRGIGNLERDKRMEGKPDGNLSWTGLDWTGWGSAQEGESSKAKQ